MDDYGLCILLEKEVSYISYEPSTFACKPEIFCSAPLLRAGNYVKNSTK